jgi:hypothetical protein
MATRFDLEVFRERLSEMGYDTWTPGGDDVRIFFWRDGASFRVRDPNGGWFRPARPEEMAEMIAAMAAGEGDWRPART